MNFRKKCLKLFVIIIFIFLGSISNLTAQNDYGFGKITYLKAINVAGKQRMLSQKMSKAHLYLIDNPNSSNASRDLLVYKIIFDKQLELLENNNENEDIDLQIRKVISLWSDFKLNIEKTPSYFTANKVIGENTDLLNEADKLVNLIVTEAQKSAFTYSKPRKAELSEIINISGKQRMLSQRLGLYYYASKNKFDDHIISNSIMEDIFIELDEAISYLLVSNFNTSEIESSLAVATVEFDKISKNKEKFFNHQFSDLEIYKITDNMTAAFNNVTILYEELGDHLLNKEN